MTILVPTGQNEMPNLFICLLLLFFFFRNMPLQLQTRLSRAESAQKTTTIYHRLAAADDIMMETDSQEEPDSQSAPQAILKDEVTFFSREMKSWRLLEKPWQEFLAQYAQQVLSGTPRDIESPRFIKTISYLKNLHYGVTNSMAHLSGKLISRAINQSKTSHI